MIPQVRYTQWRAKEGVHARLSHGQPSADGDGLSDPDNLSSEDESETGQPGPVATTDDDDDDLDNVHNVSIVSAETITGADDHHPDLTILHTCQIAIDDPVEDLGEADQVKRTRKLEKAKIHKQQRFGHQIYHQCPALLGEMKRNASRSYILTTLSSPEVLKRKKKDLKEDLHALTYELDSARLEMVEYLEVFFQRYPKLKEVLAFVSAGPYWQAAIMTKRDLPNGQGDAHDYSPNTDQQFIAYHAKYGHVHELGSPESDKALTKLRDGYLHKISLHH
ncbi:hypothetical protein BDP27DRAFT_1397277 [Rhodocollybia butyracea]|uniref:Uncharacterized protein n=1 Tax=Rhodocollybia butyracea TaxID=206335 RepID=A0A9P5QAI8_9AGAR|nr:hypothetical protein BDP27DRAFT_1397277 [Rhodocollybia butyracea]